MSVIALADLSIPVQAGAVAELLAQWEPRLELLTGDEECRVYEPDGTFYGICLSVETSLAVRHKRRTLRRGDAFVVPAGVSVDVDPPHRFMAIRHDGTPPNHFRERFIQTWGLDPRPVDPAQLVDESYVVLPDDPLRYRFTYRVFVPRGCEDLIQTDWSVHLVLGLEGDTMIESEVASSLRLRPDFLAWIPPGTTYHLSGSGCVGVLALDTEVAYEAKRIDRLSGFDQQASPEYRPDVLSEPNN